MLIAPSGRSSIEMNRIRSGISKRNELAESAGRGGQPGFALPGKPHVQGMNIVIHRLEIDAMSFERPRPRDDVGQYRDAHAARPHAATGSNGQGTEDDVGDVPRTLQVAH